MRFTIDVEDEVDLADLLTSCDANRYSYEGCSIILEDYFNKDANETDIATICSIYKEFGDYDDGGEVYGMNTAKDIYGKDVPELLEDAILDGTYTIWELDNGNYLIKDNEYDLYIERREI